MLCLMHLSFGLGAAAVAGIVLLLAIPSCSSTGGDGESSGGPDASFEASPCDPDAGKCGLDQSCQKDVDCVTLNCDATKMACAPATCSDGKQNENETGTDCGGVCPACDGAACAKDDDCHSEKCAPNNTCGPSAGKTCGVGLPNPCKDGDTCGQDLDCTSDYCATGPVCAECSASAHADGRKDCGETDVDCGGTMGASLCGTGKICGTNTDCEGLCDPTAKTCLAPTHTDAKISPSIGETDVDCGGTITDVNGVKPVRCRSAKQCLLGPDCDSYVCTAKVCEPRKAGRQDGDESDVDCGGTADPDTGVAQPRCPDDGKCYASADCADPYCNLNHPTPGVSGASEGVCVAAQSCTGTGGALAGIESCGSRETGDATAVHESCCHSLPLPTTTTVRLDKFEVTSGRFRQFVNAVGPNIRGWAQGEITKGSPTGTRLANDLPTVTIKGASASSVNLLPASANGGEALNLLVQIGNKVFDTETPSTSQGCANGMNQFGANTYYWDLATRQKASAGAVARKYTQAQYDEKPMNCATYFMYAAFCAWDGGRMPRPAEVAEAWGGNHYPFAAPYQTTMPTSQFGAGLGGVTYGFEQILTNYFNNSPAPNTGLWYHFPDFAASGAGDSSDESGYIAAPGRFILDKTANTSGNGQAWMDMGSNVMELTRYLPGISGHQYFCDWTVFDPVAGDVQDANNCADNAKQHGGTPGVVRASGLPNAQWVGGSWEGHAAFSAAPGAADNFFSISSYQLSTGTQYGKTGVRCAR